MFGRKRRQQRRFDRAATRYKMRQRMISIGDDHDIEDDQGERVFKLDGKALRIRKTILFKDTDGRDLVKIQERMLHLRGSMEIEGPVSGSSSAWLLGQPSLRAGLADHPPVPGSGAVS